MHITCVLRKYVLVWVSLKRKRKKKLFCKLYILLQSIQNIKSVTVLFWLRGWWTLCSLVVYQYGRYYNEQLTIYCWLYLNPIKGSVLS